ncbi:TPA: GNAT family N-acetyltransferase [Serratia marcescens]|uniref:GNAT family N-acetyltransferase n=1 Tax=Serratia marcescens TaxID=615 RepID=A0A5C7CLM4_SERMA|nr:GNAT family N-acetyltransferase [Serratia marcescens]TXE36366.1 GNAT family N-acetyltransferase [Serratia marcescens]TXE60773.1 GNAT family N-acetyltransferase [Serratia marcescens]
MAFSLEQAPLAQRPLLAAMLSDCLHELGVDGDYPYLPLYWREAGRYPYLMLSDRQTAGFALVRRLDSATVEMAEFYIKPEWRRNGMGQRAARALFARHPGGWSLSVSQDNPRGLAFWRSVIPAGAKTEPLSAHDALILLRFYYPPR